MNVVSDYAKALIQAKARQLCRKGFSPSEQEDIEQELLLKLWKARDRFDPQLSHPHAFITMVVSRAVAMLLRRRWCRKRGATPLSLEGDFTSTGEGLNAQLEQTEAVECALARMPDHLRDICRRLMAGQSKASIARELGMSRAALYGLLKDIRERFERSDLRDYLA